MATHTTRPARKTTAKKTAAKKTTTKKDASKATPRDTTAPVRAPRKTTPKVDLRKPLPTRTRTSHHPTISPSELAEIRAAVAATAAGIRVPVLGWTATTAGCARQDFPTTGRHITYNPTKTVPLTAHTPCARGAHHDRPISSPADLIHAIRDADQCTADHGLAVWPEVVHVPRVRPLADALARPALPPAPQPAAEPEPQHDADATQEMDVRELRAELATDAPKEHPEP